MRDANAARRELLRLMALSPLTGLLPGAHGGLSRAREGQAGAGSAADASNLSALEAVARERLDADAWEFLAGGADDRLTLAANLQAFRRLQIRARRLVDVRSIDTGLELLGERLSSPILIAPIGLQALYHPEGEKVVARAAAARGHRMIASTLSSVSIGEIAAAGGEPPWFQLYPTPDRGLTQRLLERAEAAGCRVVALTVDTPVPGNRETQTNVLSRLVAGELALGNFETTPASMFDAGLSWSAVDWLRAHTRMKLVLKGIVRRDDAERAASSGVDGLIVSNHRGRQEESNRSSLESLVEVLEGAGDRLEVLVDGGVRRGTDVFKALALGARAVCIGRPYGWGLAAYAQPGVERVLELLQAELVLIMKLAGTPRLADITRDSVTEPGPLLGA